MQIIIDLAGEDVDKLNQYIARENAFRSQLANELELEQHGNFAVDILRKPLTMEQVVVRLVLQSINDDQEEIV